MNQPGILGDPAFRPPSDFENPRPQFQELPNEAGQPEQVIFMQDAVSPEDKKKSFFALHFIGEIFLFLLLMIMLGFSIKNIYSQENPYMASIIMSAMIYNILYILLNVGFYFFIDKRHLLKDYYFIDGLTAFTKWFLYLGFYLYSIEKINDSLIGYFVYPDLIVRLALYCSRNVQSSTMQTIPLLHSFSLLIIAGYLEDKSLYGLSMAFMIYYFFGILLTSVVILMWMVFGYLFKVYLTAPAILNTFFPDLLDQFLKKISLYLLFCCWFTWHTFTYFMFVWGIHQFLAKGLITKAIEITENIKNLPGSLGIAGKGLTILGIIDILIYSVTLFLLRNHLQVLIEKFKGKEITFQSFKESIKLNLQKQGENYFKRTSKTLEPLIDMQEHTDGHERPSQADDKKRFGECQICLSKASDTWFEPCGHAVVCQDCLKDFLKQYSSCLFCRGKITKVHLIYWDFEANAYKSKGVYNLDSK